MRVVKFLLAFSAISVAALPYSTLACGGYGDAPTRLKIYAERAFASDGPSAGAAIDALRAAGQKGLDQALETYDRLIAESQPTTGKDGQPIAAVAPLDSAAQARLAIILDRIAAQRDSRASRLFWYTDFDAAKIAAQRAGKPILSLRLLGQLTDEYSCANSRFFRSTLYANAEVSNHLRENFILHWKSVRPVPKVTIDFGDGRTLHRTVTGNSIHYVLSSEGKLIDALPGLYGPQAFLAGLARAEQAIANSTGDSPTESLAVYHQRRADQLRAAWTNDLHRVGGLPAVQTATYPVPSNINHGSALAQASSARATATSATLIARPKSEVELPILTVLNLAPADLEKATTDSLWSQIARQHMNQAELDASSKNLIAQQNPTVGQAAAVAITKTVVESPLNRLFRNLQASIALDTVRNEYLLHRQIHEWLATECKRSNPDLDAFNERVYAQLFLTPSSDPWLGLLPADTYSALEHNGVVR